MEDAVLQVYEIQAGWWLVGRTLRLWWLCLIVPDSRFMPELFWRNLNGFWREDVLAEFERVLGGK